MKCLLSPTTNTSPIQNWAKSKNDTQHDAQREQGHKEKQRSTKYYPKNKKSSNTNAI
jgi:hypothetical protein